MKLGKLINTLINLKLSPELEVEMVIETEKAQYSANLGDIAVPTRYEGGSTQGVATRVVLLSEGFT